MSGKRFAEQSQTLRGYRSRVRMPIFRYFAVVTPCLIGLLFIVAAAFDAKPLQTDVPVAVHPTGNHVQVTVSLPILTVREAPPPPAWAIASIEDQAMARQNEPMKHAAAKRAGGQSKNPKGQVRPQRSGESYIAATMPRSYDAVGRIW